MIPEFTTFLEKYKKSFLEAEDLINRFPFAKDNIVCSAISGNTWLGNLGNEYKNNKGRIYLHFDIRRIFYGDQIPTNYTNEVPINSFLTEVYVNICSLFGDNGWRVASTFIPKNKVFYADTINSTFYMKDDELIPFLDELLNWYLEEKVKVSQKLKEKEIYETEEKLKKLKALTETKESK